MPTERWSRTEQWYPGWAPTVESVSKTSVNSTGRDAEGHLILGNNPFDYQHRRNVSKKLGPVGADGRIPGPEPTGHWYARTQSIFAENATAAGNRAYAKFVKNLRSGQGANLGVTFGSLPKTLDMIASKGEIVSRHMEKGPRLPDTLLGRGKRRAEIYSGAYLEWIFGWTPLYKDMVDSLTTAITHRPDQKSVFVKGVGTSRRLATYKGVSGYDFNVVDDVEIKSRVTYAARATVDNPNLWLANKLGLVALPSVAWDLVPWSFLLNGFGNFAQMVSSLTDEVGLNLYSQSVTTSHHYFGKAQIQHRAYPLSKSWATYSNRSKVRTVGSPLKPVLQMKLPDTSLEYAAMVSALVVQKASKLIPVVPPIHRQHLKRVGRPIPREYWHL